MLSNSIHPSMHYYEKKDNDMRQVKKRTRRPVKDIAAFKCKAFFEDDLNTFRIDAHTRDNHSVKCL